MSLLTLQRAFRAYLRDEPNELPNHVRPQAAAGLKVYHHAFRAQLAAALRDSFEKTLGWIGDEAFETAAAAHIAAVAPSSWTLGHYGQGFPATLNEIYPDDPEVGEIAELDWALRQAFVGPDAVPIPPDRLATVDWTCATIELAPTLSVLRVTTNAAALWTAMADGVTPPPAQLLAEPAAIRVWRQALSPHFASMDKFEDQALAMIVRGVPFPIMCEAMAAKTEIETIGRLLGEWLRDGLIVGIMQTYATSPTIPK